MSRIPGTKAKPNKAKSFKSLLQQMECPYVDLHVITDTTAMGTPITRTIPRSYIGGTAEPGEHVTLRCLLGHEWTPEPH